MEPSPLQLPGSPLAVGRTAEIYAWGEEQVVKLFRAGAPAALADKEAFAGRIVAEAGVHAPPVGETVVVAGRRGIVYGRIDGESMLVRLRRRPWQVAGLARTLGRLHAKMHGVERPQLPSVVAYLRREIEGTEATGDLTPAVRAAVLARLDALPEGRAVCHGDYHPDNVILVAGGPVIIDWMTAGHGNPDADVARTVLMIRQGEPPDAGALEIRQGEPPDAGALEIRLSRLLRRRLLAVYLRSYRALRRCPDSAIEAWIPVVAAARLSEGIATERAQLIALADGAVGR